jgi:hypothetical protein
VAQVVERLLSKFEAQRVQTLVSPKTKQENKPKHLKIILKWFLFSYLSVVWHQQTRWIFF